MRRRALLAIAFASGLLSPQLPALSKDDANSTNLVSLNELNSPDSVMQRILNNAELDNETRVFYILLMANSYLQGNSASAVDAQFISAATESLSERSWNRRKRQWEGNLVFLAERVAEDHTTVSANNKNVSAGSNNPHSHSSATPHSTLANSASKPASHSNHASSQSNITSHSNHADSPSNATSRATTTDAHSNAISHSNSTDLNSNAMSHLNRTNPRSIPDENLALAKEAIQQALVIMDDIHAPFTKLNMYFVASQLFRKMGNLDEMQKCNVILEKNIQSYASGSTAHEEEIKAAASVLDSMSYGLIPLRIADQAPLPTFSQTNTSTSTQSPSQSQAPTQASTQTSTQTPSTSPIQSTTSISIQSTTPLSIPTTALTLSTSPTKTIAPTQKTSPKQTSMPPLVASFTEKDFQASEKLKLRAVALADRLDPSNHVRRKAHRDLALWYKQLGKNQLADKEKQVLFELVGINDDSILYPYSPGCADLVWWKKDEKKFGYDCGMG